jgi:signal transduction histidine kinase
MDDADFRRDVDAAVSEYERLIGGYASNTHRMLDQLGLVGALSKLMADSKIQKGLRTLAKADRLDLSFEAAVVKHQRLFPRRSSLPPSGV